MAYSREIVELAYRVNFDDSDAVALYERAVADKNDTSNVASIKRNDSTLDFEDVEDDDLNDNNNDVEEYDNDDDEFDNNSDNSDNDVDVDDDDEKDASEFVTNTKSTRSTRSRSNKKRKVTKNTSTVAMNDTMNIIDIIKREKIENANDNEEDSLIEEEEEEGKVEEQAANVDDSNQTTNIENNQTSSNIAVDPSSRRAKRLAFREQLTRSISSEHYEYYCYCARATLVSSYSRFRKWLAATPQKK